MFKRCLAFFIFSAFLCKGQLYSNGQNSSSVKWRQIRTDDFQIIFPADFNSKAVELANYIAAANKYSREYINSKPKKISIILQNNTTVDNGFVTLAPWRSEFYAVPSQENEGVDWLKKLAIHEYRHVIQIEKFNEGIGKLLFILMGEQGLGALIVATTPLWMMEGDAVSIETRYTAVGRGEYGPFLREFKAQVAESDSYSYEKASFGSFKDFVTDHYKLGYFMVEHIKVTYGENVIDSVLTCVRRNPFVPFPFSYHLKKVTGKTTVEIYQEVVDKLKNEAQLQLEETTEIDFLSPESKDYLNFYNPVVDGFGGLFCFEDSYDKIPTLVHIKDQKVQKILTVGRLDKNSFSLSGDYLVWAEKRRDPRWQYRDYSEVILFNFKTKKRKRIKRRTRWFSPDIDELSEKMVVVSVNKANGFQLVVLNLEGEILKKSDTLDGIVYHPRWEGNEIIFTELLRGESHVKKWNFVTGAFSEITKVDFPLSFPRFYQKGILAQASIDGKDQIIFMKKDSVFSVVTPQFGLQFFDEYKDSIYYSDYHSTGSRIGVSKIKMKFLRKNRASKEESKSDDSSSSQYEVKKYYPLLHLFNIHSWAPFSFYPASQSAKIGGSVFSQDKLGISTTVLNYDYNWFQNSSQFAAEYDFSFLYPALFIKYEKGSQPNAVESGVATSIKQESLIGGGRLNLLFDNNSYSKYVNLLFAYVQSKTDYDFSDTYKDTLVVSENLQSVVAFSTALRRAKKNIYSRYSLSLQARTFFNLRDDNHAFYYKTQSTLPGLFKNHGFKFAFSEQLSGNRFVPNYITEPLGYLKHGYEDARKMELEYGFPVWYPDLVISHFAYFQRIKMAVFYERMWLNTAEKDLVLASAGLSVEIEFNPFRYSYLTKFGVDISRTDAGEVGVFPTFRVTY